MKRTHVIATVAAAAVALGAVGGTTVAFADDRPGDDTAAGGKATVTAVQAIDTALEARPGTVVSADLDGDDDHAWEVEVLGRGTTAYTVHVDATTGKVLSRETEDDADDNDERTALKGATVDAREAAGAGGAKGFVTSVSLDDDDDDRAAAAWDVETTKGDWQVDPKTAAVTADRDDSDARTDDARTDGTRTDGTKADDDRTAEGRADGDRTAGDRADDDTTDDDHANAGKPGTDHADDDQADDDHDDA
ncbi:PepSY domain-containing protein [Streptomyces sp. NPDC090127]|uniref:PepSY domain-containing protein n=1 Tax=Streptomyces sp. NPDC090127 TaxID=3365953 RepID=UPI00382C5EBC